jgi:hypothetical protein
MVEVDALTVETEESLVEDEIRVLDTDLVVLTPTAEEVAGRVDVDVDETGYCIM